MMNDNKFVKTDDFPEDFIDDKYIRNYISNDYKQMEEETRKCKELLNDKLDKQQKTEQAIEQTAENTDEINIQLQGIIDQQSNYIDILEKSLSNQTEQLNILRDIFSAGADSTAIEREIEEDIQDQIDPNHSIKDFLKDKVGDLAVTGITAGIPVLYNAFKQLLLSKGIILP